MSVLLSFFKILKFTNKKIRRSIPIAIFCLLIVSIMEVLGIGLIFPLAQAIVDIESLQTKEYFQYVSNLLGIYDPILLIKFTISTVFGIFIAKGILASLLVRWQCRFIEEMGLSLYERILDKYVNASYLFHKQKNPTNLVYNVTALLNDICIYFLSNGLALISEVIVALGLIALLFFLNPYVILFFVIFTFLSFYFFSHFVRRKTKQIGENCMQGTRELMRNTLQYFLALKEFRVLGREKDFASSLLNKRRQLNKTLASRNFLQKFPRYYIEISFSIAILFLLLIIMSYMKSSDTFALFSVMGVAFARLMPSANRILTAQQGMKVSIPSVNKLRDVLEHSDLETNENPDDNFVSNERNKLLSWEKLIFKNVNFCYPERSENILNNLNLKINCGESIGIVGTSGTGKSTLIDMLLGLLKPQTGVINIDDENLNDVKHQWMRTIGYVPQDVHLLDDTLRRNIALGIPDHEIDNETINAVVKKVQLKTFVEELPEGLNTTLGEFGVRVSGGQKQRIGLARALYNEPSTLVLDEATSSLDNETERYIISMIRKFYGTKTLIIVAHRLSTVRYCDRIFFLQDGRIIAEGSFDELKNSNKDFERLVELGTVAN